MACEGARTRLEQELEMAQQEDLGDRIEGVVADRIVALVSLLGASFGVGTVEMNGDDQGATEPDRRGLARCVVSCWAPVYRGKEAEKHYSGRALKPQAAIRAVKRALEVCEDFPSEGLLATLAAGGRPRYWPGGALGGLGPRRFPPGRDALLGAEIAAEWAEDSRRRGLNPEGSTPDNIAKGRAREIQRRFGVDITTGVEEPIDENLEPGWDG